jgi:hypothetical protein
MVELVNLMKHLLLTSFTGKLWGLMARKIVKEQLMGA